MKDQSSKFSSSWSQWIPEGNMTSASLIVRLKKTHVCIFINLFNIFSIIHHKVQLGPHCIGVLLLLFVPSWIYTGIFTQLTLQFDLQTLNNESWDFQDQGQDWDCEVRLFKTFKTKTQVSRAPQELFMTKTKNATHQHLLKSGIDICVW